MFFLRQYLGLIVVLIISMLSILPFFITGFFPVHDDTQVARVFEMGKALRDGMFPVRWVADLGYGYGYPLFNFYAPLSYYVGGFFTLVGFDALFATKIIMGLGIVLAGIFMYLLARTIWGEIGGIISALFYVYAPYHAIDVYVRGDVAEFWAYAFIPLAALGFYKIFTTKKFIWKWVAISSLGYAGVILSHNLTAMMITPFLFIAICITFPTIRYALCAIFLGLALSAFYWLPALLEMQHTNVLSQIGGAADFRNHFVCISQLWESQWGFGGSTHSCIDGMSYRIGKLYVVLSFFSILLFFVTLAIKKSIKKYSLFLFSIGGLITSIFLMLGISMIAWETLPLMEFFQYPWRFLLLSSFFTSLIIGAIPFFLHTTIRSKQFSQMAQCICAFVFLSLLLFFNIKLFQPQTIMRKTAVDYTNKIALVWTASNISDEYMPKDFRKPENASSVPASIIEPTVANTNITIVEQKTNFIKAKISFLNSQLLHLNIAYFPAWKIFIDNKEIPPTIDPKGTNIDFPQGTHMLSARFVETPIEKLANTLTLIGIGILITGIITFKKKKMYS